MCEFVRQDWQCHENGDAGCCDWLRAEFDCPGTEVDCIIYVGTTQNDGAQWHCQPKQGGGEECIETI
jgi:hypothetical protein